MNRIFTLAIACLLCTHSAKAVLKTWIGGNSTWNTAGNWSPSGVPTFNDTALFNTSVTVNVDVAGPQLAALQVKSSATVIFSSASPVTITIGNGGTPVEALLIESGSFLTLGSGSAVSLQTYGASSTNTANIYGTLTLGQGASVWTVAPFSASASNCTSNVYGRVVVASNNTAGIIAGTGISNLRFFSASALLWQRNGGAVPPADFQNGSIINITGITSSAIAFNTPANYNGLLIWNCTGQTTTGGAALLLPSPSTTMDSIRVVSTGATGTLRLATNPSGYTIGHLEVQGGTLELSAPVGTARFGTINTDFKISGGSVIGNATYAFDNLAPDSMRLIVNGNLVMSGGSFNLSNRPPALLSGGSFGMTVKGDIIQSGGTISCSSDFSGLSPSRINYIEMAGTAAQNVTLNTWSGPIQFIANNTSGINLLANLTCPDTLYLKTGYMQLNNFNVQSAAGKFKTQVVSPTPRMVTNGTGHLTLTGLASAATATFPVTPIVNSISSVILKNNDISANTFDVRVERGNNPAGIFNTGLTVNRTWIINDATNIGANSVELKFLYPDTAINVLCNRSGAMELGHFPVSAWSVDPVATTRIPSQGAGVNTTDTTGVFAPNSLDSAFVLGNQFSILTLNAGITLNYFKGNKQAAANVLNWSVNCTSNQAKFEVQRSNNGISFSTIGNITASYTRCLQPFDFADNNPQAGINYYRIKITDVDGRVTYSTWVLLQSKEVAAGAMALLPTLVNKPLAILYIDAAKPGPVQVNITDANGRTVQTVKEAVIAGQNQLTLNFEQLQPGVYYISAYGNNQKWSTVRFVKL
jgi:hypothetical protein